MRHRADDETGGAATAGLPAAAARRDAFRALIVAAACGLLFWEFWARVVAPPLIGGPIEPAELVLSFISYWTGLSAPRLLGEAVNVLSLILAFPLLYRRLSRTSLPWGAAMDLAALLAFVGFVVRDAATGDDLPTGIILGLVLVPFVLSRLINPSRELADAASLGAFTWFTSLAVIAPLSGLPFLLLEWGGQLSFVSFVGHTLYGVVMWAVLRAQGYRPDGRRR